MRSTLQKYYGKRVIIKGTVKGFPTGHENTGLNFDKKTNDFPEYRTNIVITGNDNYCGVRSAVRFPEKATCIVNIKGIYGFEDIVEDHINIQENLIELWKLHEGDEIIISGFVVKYKKTNAYDYTLIKVERYKNDFGEKLFNPE